MYRRFVLGPQDIEHPALPVYHLRYWSVHAGLAQTDVAGEFQFRQVGSQLSGNHLSELLPQPSQIPRDDYRRGDASPNARDLKQLSDSECRNDSSGTSVNESD